MRETLGNLLFPVTIDRHFTLCSGVAAWSIFTHRRPRKKSPQTHVSTIDTPPGAAWTLARCAPGPHLLSPEVQLLKQMLVAGRGLPGDDDDACRQECPTSQKAVDRRFNLVDRRRSHRHGHSRVISAMRSRRKCSSKWPFSMSFHCLRECRFLSPTWPLSPLSGFRESVWLS